MEKMSIILMGIAIFLYPIWLLLSQIFENNSIYPRKSDWVIGALGILTIASFVLGVIFCLMS